MIKESCNVAQDDDVNQPAMTVPLYLAAHNQRCGSSGEGTVWGERDTEGGEGGRRGGGGGGRGAGGGQSLDGKIDCSIDCRSGSVVHQQHIFRLFSHGQCFL